MRLPQNRWIFFTVALLLQATVSFSNDPPLVKEGKEALFNGHYEQAVECFAETVLANSKNPETCTWLTLAREFEEDPEAAEAEHRFGFSSCPKTSDGLAERSRFFKEHDEFQRALDDVNELLRTAPVDRNARYSKHMCYWMRAGVYRYWGLFGNRKDMLQKSEEDKVSMNQYPDMEWEDAVPVRFTQPKPK